jgi:hypothetical protein
MKVALQSSMSMRIAVARDAINAHFAAVAAQQAHRDQAHTGKRAVATQVTAGTSLSDDDPFAVEASLRSMSIADLAMEVLSKPDTFAARELERQRLLLAVEAAKTPAEIETAIASLGA